MKNFKGLFHNQKIEAPCFEGGAHFKYSDLINRLNTIIQNLPSRRLSEQPSNNGSSLDEILFNKERIRIKKHISKNKQSLESKKHRQNSEFFLPKIPKINSNILNYYKNTIDVKSDSINNLITNDTISNVEKTALPKIITKSDGDLNKKRKKNHKRVVTDENVLLKSENLNSKKKKSYQRIITENNKLLKSENLINKKNLYFIQEEKSETNIDDYNKIISPYTLKQKKKINYENDEDILQRINDLKKQLLGLNNEDKKIKLKHPFMIK